jgi:hypothetical protein
MDYHLLKLGLASLATIGLYTVLYRENKFYRFWEHVFVGLVAGYSLVAIWAEILKTNWWDRMVGQQAADGNPAQPGYWLYVLLLPIGLMGYTIFSRKHNWISRIPIGIILGLYSGQQFLAWQNRYLPQVADSARPVLPTPGAGFFKPDVASLPPARAAEINAQVSGSQALSNLIFVITLLSVVSYFLFSFDVRNKALARVTGLGRWLLMIGFGAIFGSTVMMRFTLLIDRMYFIWIEFFRQGLFHR